MSIFFRSFRRRCVPSAFCHRTNGASPDGSTPRCARESIRGFLKIEPWGEVNTLTPSSQDLFPMVSKPRILCKYKGFQENPSEVFIPRSSKILCLKPTTTHLGEPTHMGYQLMGLKSITPMPTRPNASSFTLPVPTSDLSDLRSDAEPPDDADEGRKAVRRTGLSGIRLRKEHPRSRFSSTIPRRNPRFPHGTTRMGAFCGSTHIPPSRCTKNYSRPYSLPPARFVSARAPSGRSAADKPPPAVPTVVAWNACPGALKT